MNLFALPAFSDNSIWMLHDGARALVVDPGDAGPVRAALDAARLTLAAILVTHPHAEHAGGIEALRERPAGPGYGLRRERATQTCPIAPNGVKRSGPRGTSLCRGRSTASRA
jgi:hydroxyacylglutathione hydrolase